MRIRFLASVVLSFAAVWGCAKDDSSKPGTVEKSSCAYRNSFDFVFDSAETELKQGWKISEAKRSTKTITTGWATNLSPFSSQGRRDRLVVTITGDQRCGWKASAKQESETNTNELNPLDEKKAKWDAIPNDGGLAARFLQNLDARLQPDERWRDQLTR
jgi:hypothetical protein